MNAVIAFNFEGIFFTFASVGWRLKFAQNLFLKECVTFSEFIFA